MNKSEYCQKVHILNDLIKKCKLIFCFHYVCKYKLYKYHVSYSNSVHINAVMGKTDDLAWDQSPRIWRKS